MLDYIIIIIGVVFGGITTAISLKIFKKNNTSEEKLKNLEKENYSKQNIIENLNNEKNILQTKIESFEVQHGYMGATNIMYSLPKVKASLTTLPNKIIITNKTKDITYPVEQILIAIVSQMNIQCRNQDSQASNYFLSTKFLSQLTIDIKFFADSCNSYISAKTSENVELLVNEISALIKKNVEQKDSQFAQMDDQTMKKIISKPYSNRPHLNLSS